jgi:hypothetical protein
MSAHEKRVLWTIGLYTLVFLTVAAALLAFAPEMDVYVMLLLAGAAVVAVAVVLAFREYRKTPLDEGHGSGGRWRLPDGWWMWWG